MQEKVFDVIIVGGSYAGLSAALCLGRSLRSVLVIDAGHPCNTVTPHAHNLLTNDATAPKSILARAREEVSHYETVTFLQEEAIAAEQKDGLFKIRTTAGQDFRAKKLLFATGIQDIMPEHIDGFSACWGKTIVQCPYCHGYELRNQKTAVYAELAMVVHQLPLLYNLSKDISIIGLDQDDFGLSSKEQFEKQGIRLIPSSPQRIVHDAGKVRAIIFEDGHKESFDVVYATVPFRQHSELPVALGCALTKQGYIEIDSTQKTSVEGIYACGDNANFLRTLSNAIHSGNKAGININSELAQEDFNS